MIPVKGRITPREQRQRLEQAADDLAQKINTTQDHYEVLGYALGQMRQEYEVLVSEMEKFDEQGAQDIVPKKAPHLGQKHTHADPNYQPPRSGGEESSPPSQAYEEYDEEEDEEDEEMEPRQGPPAPLGRDISAERGPGRPRLNPAVTGHQEPFTVDQEHSVRDNEVPRPGATPAGAPPKKTGLGWFASKKKKE